MSRRSRFITASCGWAVAIALSGCEPRTLQEVYCEGGVVKSRGGGACLFIHPAKNDPDPTTVGSFAWPHGDTVEQYVIRKAGKATYSLYQNGTLAGSIDQNGYWITLKLSNEAKVYHLRSDAPGPFI